MLSLLLLLLATSLWLSHDGTSHQRYHQKEQYSLHIFSKL